MSSILKSKNLMLYLIILVLVIFTIVYFTLANNISYSLTTDVNLYDSEINLITNVAQMYAEGNPDIFEDKDYAYFLVEDLVESGYLAPDNENGDVLDPTSEVKTLNDLKIKAEKKNDKIVITVLN